MGTESDSKAWHELFDALAIAKGHNDNFELARAYCSANRAESQSAFEAAVKNLRNWRSGLHVPQRRNFLVISKLLEIDAQPLEFQEQWHNAYVAARMAAKRNALEGAMDEGEDRGVPRSAELMEGGFAQRDAIPAGRAWRRKHVIALVIVSFAVASTIGVLLGAAVIAPTTSGTGMPGLTLPGNFAGTTDQARRVVMLRPGEAMIVGAVSAPDCDGVPSWDEVEAMLPPLETGQFADGGEGTRYDATCGARVPARGVLFQAESIGQEQFVLGAEPVVIRVY